MMRKARSTHTNRLLGKMVCGLWLALTMYSAEGLATNYYIATTGDDRNPGTLSSPWATINKANATLVAGDIVYLRSGEYQETIKPANSGQPGNRITYENYPNETVTVSGAYFGSPVVSIGGSISYITVEGLNIKQATPGSATFDVIIYGSHSEIRNCRIVNTANPITQASSGIQEIGILITGAGANYNFIEGNHIEGLSKQGIKFKNAPRFNVIRNNTVLNNIGDAIRIDSSRGVLMGNLIENNRLGGSLASDGIQFDADWDLPAAEQALDTGNRGTIIRNNWIFDNAENGIDLKGTSNIIIEGNYIFSNVGDNDGSVIDTPDRLANNAITKGGGAGTSSKDVIIRNNTIYDNKSGVYLLEHYLIYNNNIIANNLDYTGPNSTYYANGQPAFLNVHGYSRTRAALKNNIIGGEITGAEIDINSDANLDINNNIYFNSTSVTFASGPNPWTHLDFNGWLNLLDTMTNVLGKDKRSQAITDPMFVNVPLLPVGRPDNFDFRLAKNSPAIDAGTNLTNAVGSGNGSRITLKDAGYFYDGFGVTFGDSIRIGTNDSVRVLAIDYATNTITVDRNISWADNDPVNLDYSGSAADIGALEYTSQTAVPSTPTGLALTIK